MNLIPGQSPKNAETTIWTALFHFQLTGTGSPNGPILTGIYDNIHVINSTMMEPL